MRQKQLRQCLQALRLRLSHRIGFGPSMAALVFIAAAVVGWHFALATSHREPVCKQAPEKPLIAILSFFNMSEDPALEYVSDGITEEITSLLAKNPSLFVIAHQVMLHYPETKRLDISKELGVRYVLEGSVQKADGQVRIIAQLIDAITGEHLWSERYDRSWKDNFSSQNKIEQEIVQQVEATLLALPPRMVTVCLDVGMAL